jgi:hypothetical protein
MVKKSPLTLVLSRAHATPEAPRPLGEAGRSLWVRVMTAYAIDDVGGREILFQACAAADTAEELSAVIAVDGARFLTKQGPKAHPCLKDRLAARAFVVKAIRTLGLDIEAVYPGPGRPGRGIGWRPDDA